MGRVIRKVCRLWLFAVALRLFLTSFLMGHMLREVARWHTIRLTISLDSSYCNYLNHLIKDWFIVKG